VSEPQLVILATASYAGAVGYAELYRCRVRETLVGDLNEDEVRLTVLPGDRERIAFLTAHPEPQEIEIGFSMASSDAPYPMVPITGFVDSGRRAWQVEYIHEAGG
jgi:hypothetical protein